MTGEFFHQCDFQAKKSSDAFASEPDFYLLIVLTLDNIIDHDIKLVVFKTVALLFGR